MQIETILSVVVGSVIGGLVTWFFSWKYYQKAGDDLRAETELLKKANRVIVFMLENPQADFLVKHDAFGNPTTTMVSTELRASGKATASFHS